MSRQQRPDIVLIMVDQLSAKWLEAAEDRGVCDLPHLRRLREAGTSFSRTISANPVCTPTRSTIMTGLTSRGHGVIENGYELDPAIPTFPQALQEAGYTTSAVGKVHVVPHHKGFDPDYRPYGFDHQLITEDDRGGPWLDEIRSRHPEWADAALQTVWAADVDAFSDYGPDHEDLAARIRQLRAAAHWAGPGHPEDTAFAYTLPFPAELSQTEWITRGAESVIADHGPEPMFLQVSYVQPHNPFGVPGPYLERVDRSRLPPRVTATWRDDPQAPAFYARQPVPTVDDHDYRRFCYFADLVHLDEQVGRILEALAGRDGWEQTYLIFVSDHGELLGDHDFYGKEERHFDACVRVPLYISGPGLAAGRRDDRFVQHEDLCPTLLEMGGAGFARMPSGDGHGVDRLPGTSLLARCRDEDAPAARRTAYVESYNGPRSQRYDDWVRTVRTERWRYTYHAGDRDEELYDLLADPDETTNVSTDPAVRATLHQLRAELLEALLNQDWPKPGRSLFRIGVH